MFRVLLPVGSDGDRARRAAEVVTSIPHDDDQIEVTILNVEKRIDARDSGGQVSSDDWYDEEEFPDFVGELRELLEASGIAVELRREHDDPAQAIVEIANEIGADRIVMSGRKRSPTGKVLFGSTTQSVLLHADVPVTVTLD